MRHKSLRESLAPTLAKQKTITESLQNNISKVENEAKRVEQIMHSAPQVIEKLNKDFEESTQLSSFDIKFLFIATGLQCLRQYVFSSESFRISANDGDALSAKIVPKAWQDVLLASVPYDAVAVESDFKANTISTGLSGTTHRFRTLGHDPLFGWVFGPVNIMTDSLTKSDVATTYSVADMKISGMYRNGTLGAFQDSYIASSNDKYLLPVAVIRQAIHFGSDYFTKQGLPLPLVGSLSNDFAKTLVTRCGIDMYSATRSASMSIFINAIIFYLHTLLNDNASDSYKSIYEVRTRKILSYSNIIASASNIVYVGINAFLGNSYAWKKFDFGGLLVTIYRIVTDYRYISQIKQEFLEKGFRDIVMGAD